MDAYSKRLFTTTSYVTADGSVSHWTNDAPMVTETRQLLASVHGPRLSMWAVSRVTRSDKRGVSWQVVSWGPVTGTVTTYRTKREALAYVANMLAKGTLEYSIGAGTLSKYELLQYATE